MIMDQQIIVHHWRHDDGWQHIPEILRKPGSPGYEFNGNVVGWHCWVYCDDHHEFLHWMETNCPTADCTPRFNSGNPMVTVFITNKNEAAYFKLNFNVE